MLGLELIISEFIKVCMCVYAETERAEIADKFRKIFKFGQSQNQSTQCFFILLLHHFHV